MLGERLAAARARAGLKQVELAAALGERYNHSVISNVERGRSSLRLDGLAAAARELAVSADYLLGLADTPTPAAQLEKSGKVKPVESSALIPFLETGPELLGESPVRHVQLVDLKASAGEGAPIEGGSRERFLAVDALLAQAYGLDTRKCAALRVEGDSMVPLLPPGSRILVDKTKRRRRTKHVFAVRLGDSLVVKRLVRVRSRWYLASDNPAYEPAPCPAGAVVLGEVVGVLSMLISPSGELAAPEPGHQVSQARMRFATDVRLAAGSGELVWDEADQMSVSVALSALAPWARPEHLWCARARGDSMKPSIGDGDLVALDPGRTEPLGGQLFGVRTGEGLVVKRLKLIGGRWHLTSDNPAYEPRPVTGDDRILGQVAWTGPPTSERG